MAFRSLLAFTLVVARVINLGNSIMNLLQQQPQPAAQVAVGED